MEQSDPHCEVAREILRTIPLVMRVVAARIRESEHDIIPAHYRTLVMLSKRDCSLTQLADLQQLSLPTISNTISALAQRGWVLRARSGDDRRVVMVALTPQGKIALQTVQDYAESHIAGLLASLSVEEEANLRTGLRTLQTVFAAALQNDASQESEIRPVS